MRKASSLVVGCVPICILLAGCLSTDVNSVSKKLHRKIYIGMPLSDIRGLVPEMIGTTEKAGLWDEDNIELQKAIAADCPNPESCFTYPNVQFGSAGRVIDWGKFLIIQAYYVPPSLSGPGSRLYLIFDKRTKLLLAKVAPFESDLGDSEP